MVCSRSHAREGRTALVSIFHRFAKRGRGDSGIGKAKSRTTWSSCGRCSLDHRPANSRSPSFNTRDASGCNRATQQPDVAVLRTTHRFATRKSCSLDTIGGDCIRARARRAPWWPQERNLIRIDSRLRLTWAKLPESRERERTSARRPSRNGGRAPGCACGQRLHPKRLHVGVLGASVLKFDEAELSRYVARVARVEHDLVGGERRLRISRVHGFFQRVKRGPEHGP